MGQFIELILNDHQQRKHNLRGLTNRTTNYFPSSILNLSSLTNFAKTFRQTHESARPTQHRYPRQRRKGT